MLWSRYIFSKYVWTLEIRISGGSRIGFPMTVLTRHSFRQRHGFALVDVVLIMRSIIWGEMYSSCSFVELLTVTFNTFFSHLDERVYQDLKITPLSVVHQMNISKNDMENVFSRKHSSVIFVLVLKRTANRYTASNKYDALIGHFWNTKRKSYSKGFMTAMSLSIPVGVYMS